MLSGLGMPEGRQTALEAQESNRPGLPLPCPSFSEHPWTGYYEANSIRLKA